MIPNSSPPRRQTTSESADRPPQHVRERDEHLVARSVAEDVVDALEVVDVQHEHGDRVVRGVARCARPEALVEVAMVVEAGERVGLRLELERLADLGVVESEGRRVPEALRKLELLLGEARVLAEAVDVGGP